MKFLDVPQSGSFAGVTRSRNRFGQYQRTRAIPVNPGSSFQMTVRARMQTNADAWKALTSTQRDGWNALGMLFNRTDSLGQTYNLDGFQAYCSVNNNNLAAGASVVSDAPAYDPPAPMATVTPTITSASFSVAWTVTPLAAGERIMIRASPQRSAGTAFNADYRLLTVSAAAATSPTNVLSAYQARFGSPITGQRIFVSVMRWKAGFVSDPLVTSVIVT